MPAFGAEQARGLYVRPVTRDVGRAFVARHNSHHRAHVTLVSPRIVLRDRSALPGERSASAAHEPGLVVLAVLGADLHTPVLATALEPSQFDSARRIELASL